LTGSEIDKRYSFSFWFKQYESVIDLEVPEKTMVAGIDPYGGIDPFSSNIIWADGTFVDAPARSTAMTVFLKSYVYEYVNAQQPRPGEINRSFIVDTYIDKGEINVVPEPQSFLLLGCGLFVLIYIHIYGTRRTIQRDHSLWEIKAE
jgi:hypothetical protein